MRRLIEEFRTSERRVCGLMEIPRMSYRYQSRRDDTALRERLLVLAREKPRYGYRRLWVLLGRDRQANEERINHKRVWRVYRDLGRSVRRTRRKRLQRMLRPRPVLTAPNQEWAVDFASDVAASGRRLRILSVVDSYTRECLALEVDTSLPSRRVTRTLAKIIGLRGVPVAIRSDNVLNASAFLNKEYTSRVDRFWSDPRFILRRTGLQWSSRLIGTPPNIMNTRSAPEAWSSLRLKRRRVPVEGPSIIYEVEDASTARASGIDPLGIRCSKKRWYSEPCFTRA